MRTLISIVAFGLMAGLLFAADKPAPDKPVTQGIRGKVLRLSGNHMPGPGPSQGKVEPLSVPVHFFKGQIKFPLKGPKEEPAFLKTIYSDKEGKYELELPPGVYTVIPEIDGKLYNNIISMDGVLPTLKVEKGKWTEHIIQDTSKAVF